MNGNVHGLSYKSGDTISYSCKSGYQLSGSKTRTCDQNTARWTGWKPECRRMLHTVFVHNEPLCLGGGGGGFNCKRVETSSLNY